MNWIEKESLNLSIYMFTVYIENKLISVFFTHAQSTYKLINKNLNKYVYL